MMQLIMRFAAFSLASGVLMTLLPEGSLRRTASMALGLMLLMMWAEGLPKVLSLPVALTRPASALVPTASTLDAAEQAAADMILSRWEAAP